MANAIPSFPPMAVPDNVEAFPSESETVKEAPFCLQIMKTVFVAVILLEKLKLVPPEELLYCWIVAGIAYAPLVPLMICACAEALGVVKVFVFVKVFAAGSPAAHPDARRRAEAGAPDLPSPHKSLQAGRYFRYGN